MDLKDYVISLVKKAIEVYLKEKKIIDPPEDIPLELKKRAGSFVSIHTKNGKLRGCIGTILPTSENLAQEIIQNAINSAFRDPRFPPVTLEELDDLEFSVDILSPLEEVKSLDELDPKKFGIVVEKGWRRGVLLPDLEGVNTVKKQLEIALAKAGIDPSEDYKIYKFTVIRYKE
ncbi:MAG: AmmeMemoRadiSam system protein A [Dictyoglomus sp.]|nr:AmmeMemoRadiSam system protein A [Dictyoglomus sp.]MCX7941817.1 AmmeMemoRadiSam system protein A [Dictyoglomaceae bacterium]MDW8188080.1 AmmeMemoRadiSam system protein A [Dictyoglomus sp.]